MYDASKDEEEDGDDDALKIAIDENATSTFSERHFNNSFSRRFILNVRWSVALFYKKNNYEFSNDYNLENDLRSSKVYKLKSITCIYFTIFPLYYFWYSLRTRQIYLCIVHLVLSNVTDTKIVCMIIYQMRHMT